MEDKPKKRSVTCSRCGHTWMSVAKWTPVCPKCHLPAVPKGTMRDLREAFGE